MTRSETAKLLSQIKIAYPTAYKDNDDAIKAETAKMWYRSFLDVPYPIMEHAFNSFLMVSKYPPTVAEMMAELKRIYFQAADSALVQQLLGNEERAKQCWIIMDYTAKYADDTQVRLGISCLQRTLDCEEICTNKLQHQQID